MKNKEKKFRKKVLYLLLITGLFCIFLLTAAIVAGIWKYHKTISSGEKVTVIRKLSVPGKILLGQKFSLKFSCRVPWGTSREMLEILTLPQNMQVTSPPFFRTVKYAWGYRILEGELPLQAYVDGKSSGGVFAFAFHSGKKGEERFEEKIPDMTVLPAKITTSELQTAEKILEKTASLVPYIAAGALLLLVIGTAVFFFFRRKRKDPHEKELPVWEQAFSAINALLTKVRSGKMRAEQSVAELTDIIRFYMEKRFSIPAEHLTSDEFFHVLHKKQDLLSSSQQDFLHKFIRSADLVKFANISAEVSLVEEAALQAENLVRETIPHPSDPAKKPSSSAENQLKGKEK